MCQKIFVGLCNNSATNLQINLLSHKLLVQAISMQNHSMIAFPMFCSFEERSHQEILQVLRCFSVRFDVLS